MRYVVNEKAPGRTRGFLWLALPSVVDYSSRRLVATNASRPTDIRAKAIRAGVPGSPPVNGSVSTGSPSDVVGAAVMEVGSTSAVVDGAVGPGVVVGGTVVGGDVIDVATTSEVVDVGSVVVVVVAGGVQSTRTSIPAEKCSSGPK